MLFLATGIAGTVAGGLVAAITAAVPTEHGAWVAAYLVLVVGVAQIGIGIGQAVLASGTPSWRVVATEFGVYNGGNAAVILGTLLALPPLVDVGGLLLVLALALLLVTTRGAEGPRWVRYLFRVLLLVLLISIPIGSLLSRMG